MTVVQKSKNGKENVKNKFKKISQNLNSRYQIFFNYSVKSVALAPLILTQISKSLVSTRNSNIV